MDRFAKDQMLNELRTIFLFEADHLLMGAGARSAQEFIGFPTPDDGQYCFAPPNLVDVARFPIARVFSEGYDFAFRPSVTNALDESEIQDLVVFMQGTPRAGGISAGGETHQFMTPDGYCQTVADAALARWKLEWQKAGTFTTRELALLANMTEGAVRNALADKTENGLKPIPNSKPVSVEHAEAWRWLSGRRGFIPSPKRPSEDRFLVERLRDISSAESLGRFIADRRTFVSLNDAPTALGWTSEEVQSWCDGSFRFDSERARQLAQAFDLDVPLFLGKALEVSLRRDAGLGLGGPHDRG